jgi:Na+/H+ antiporter NhaD/arsenite permease-like protein
LASVSELIFFLLGAMTVVEVVDTHGGFNRLAAWVRADQRQILTWFVALLTFGMSAVLDNLTTTIVMISVLQVRVLDSKACLLHHEISIVCDATAELALLRNAQRAMSTESKCCWLSWLP